MMVIKRGPPHDADRVGAHAAGHLRGQGADDGAERDGGRGRRPRRRRAPARHPSGPAIVHDLDLPGARAAERVRPRRREGARSTTRTTRRDWRRSGTSSSASLPTRRPAGGPGEASWAANLRVAVVATAGDRRDEDMRELGRVAARYFDEVIVREDRNTRGRKRGRDRGADPRGRRARRCAGGARAGQRRGGARRDGGRAPGARPLAARRPRRALRRLRHRGLQGARVPPLARRRRRCCAPPRATATSKPSAATPTSSASETRGPGGSGPSLEAAARRAPRRSSAAHGRAARPDGGRVGFGKRVGEGTTQAVERITQVDAAKKLDAKLARRRTRAREARRGHLRRLRRLRRGHPPRNASRRSRGPSSAWIAADLVEPPARAIARAKARAARRVSSSSQAKISGRWPRAVTATTSPRRGRADQVLERRRARPGTRRLPRCPRRRRRRGGVR